MRNCTHCSKTIPSTRRANAKYCSDICYQNAKNVRSAKHYQKITARHKKIKKNIAILDSFADIGEYVPLTFLEKKGFDFDIVESVKKNDDGERVYVIDAYAYRIIFHNQIKYALIWKIQQT